MSKTRVVILFGGRSTEHEISLLSARNILVALDRQRFEPVLISIDKKGRWHQETESFLMTATGDPRQLKLPTNSPPVQVPVYPDEHGLFGGDTVVFPILHGAYGEDGRLQGLLEMAGVAYVGASVLSASIGMDKDVAKRLLAQADVPVVPWRCIHLHEWKTNAGQVGTRVAGLGYPMFVKPCNAGSSVGVSKVADEHALQAALTLAFRYDDKVLVEAAVNAREIECAVLGNEQPSASVPGEIIVTHKDGFYSYEAKYTDPDGSHLQIPAPLPDEVAQLIQALALQVFKTLELSGLARVDFFVERGTLEVYLNEVNTMPGFTAISMYPKMWEASGIAQPALVTRLIEFAQARHAGRTKLQTTLA